MNSNEEIQVNNDDHKDVPPKADHKFYNKIDYDVHQVEDESTIQMLTKRLSLLNLNSYIETKFMDKKKGKEKAIQNESNDDQVEIILPNGQHQCDSCFDVFLTFNLNADLNMMATSSANLGVILNCKHKFCLTCMKIYLESVLKNSHLEFPIICSFKCDDSIITEKIVEKVLTKEGIENYYLKLAESSIKNKIYCPNVRCSAVIDYDNDDSQHTYPVKCPICNKCFCPSCLVPWHSDLTCKEFQALPIDERSPEDRVVLDLAKIEGWKRCPKCRILIQLEQGCNHMTCKCTTQFCYKCGGAWKIMENKCINNCTLWDENLLLGRLQVNQQVQIRRIQIQPVQRMRRQRRKAVNIDLEELEAISFKLSNWLSSMIENCQCGYCDRKFRRLMDLEKHLKYTSAHRVYSCCGKLFKHEMSLNQHENSVH